MEHDQLRYVTDILKLGLWCLRSQALSHNVVLIIPMFQGSNHKWWLALIAQGSCKSYHHITITTTLWSKFQLYSFGSIIFAVSQKAFIHFPWDPMLKIKSCVNSHLGFQITNFEILTNHQLVSRLLVNWFQIKLKQLSGTCKEYFSQVWFQSIQYFLGSL